MISHITIKDFAIIDSISLDFHRGLHILTGETGAGKSILIEAISLALGSRADTAYVQTGKEKAVIELTVETEEEDVFDMLQENGLEVTKTIQITRELHAGGKSVCRINGDMVSVSYLNKLCKKIADIHGQYDHQSLLNSENHLKIVDNFDVPLTEPIKDQVRDHYQSYISTKTRLESLIKSQAESLRKRDFMQFELDEIEGARVTIGEDEELSQQLLLLQNHETIFDNLSTIYELIYEKAPSCQDDLGRSVRLFQDIQTFSPEIQALSDDVSDCYYKLEDLQAIIRKAKDSISFSPEILNETVERIDVIDRLKRKYGGSIEAILAYAADLHDSLLKIDHKDQLSAELSAELIRIEKALKESSDQLSELRKQNAIRMEKMINIELEELNFKDASLSVSFLNSVLSSEPRYTETGVDRVEFLITTNKGESPKPLVKIASGGEISRIMLALKRIIGDYDNIPTMIFDEIDSGISGITASIVGRKLKQISKEHQIICITHLAQIASYSDHHYQITKAEKNGRTLSNVVPLDDKEKVQEIARLLGGMNITETTLRNAEELISQSAK
jgi:DNA repair protein RecN (Recombination protein N)